MKTTTIQKSYAIILAVVVALWGCMLLGGYDHDLAQMETAALSSDLLETQALQPGDVLTQQIEVSRPLLTALSLSVSNGRHVALTYTIEGDQLTLAQGSVDEAVPGNRLINLLNSPVDVSAYKAVTLRLTVLDGTDATLFYGGMLQLARGMVAISGLNDETSLNLNGTALPGKLNVETTQELAYNVSGVIWLLMLASVVMLACLYFYSMRQARAGKTTLLLRNVGAFKRYRFMLQQLVNRNFKTKYKRSILGILWSFLNPLQTMLIQYVVFSTLFQTNLAYFPVYLLSGTICFSFFSEATTTGLSSISGNASLITKVYIPKYIFPISTVLSSGINFSLTLIPLLATVLLSGLPVTRAYFFLPIVFLCLLALNLGITMFLATVMVFFRDIQFLWGVVTTLLMYATPLFYPESIIPDQFSFILKLNPLYHVIRLFRVILIDCAAPEPKAVFLCIAFCLLILLLGTWVFKKQQDKFVLNL